MAPAPLESSWRAHPEPSVPEGLGRVAAEDAHPEAASDGFVVLKLDLVGAQPGAGDVVEVVVYVDSVGAGIQGHVSTIARQPQLHDILLSAELG